MEVSRTRMLWTLTHHGHLVSGPVQVSRMNGTVLVNGTLSDFERLDARLHDRYCGRRDSITAIMFRRARRKGDVTLTGTPALTGGFNLRSSVCSPPVSAVSFVLLRNASL